MPAVLGPNDVLGTEGALYNGEKMVEAMAAVYQGESGGRVPLRAAAGVSGRLRCPTSHTPPPAPLPSTPLRSRPAQVPLFRQPAVQPHCLPALAGGGDGPQGQQ